MLICTQIWPQKARKCDFFSFFGRRVARNMFLTKTISTKRSHMPLQSAHLAKWSNALASGASSSGIRRFESCGEHFIFFLVLFIFPSFLQSSVSSLSPLLVLLSVPPFSVLCPGAPSLDGFGRGAPQMGSGDAGRWADGPVGNSMPRRRTD
jgi:hypothetical protein